MASSVAPHYSLTNGLDSQSEDQIGLVDSNKPFPLAKRSSTTTSDAVADAAADDEQEEQDQYDDDDLDEASAEGGEQKLDEHLMRKLQDMDVELQEAELEAIICRRDDDGDAFVDTKKLNDLIWEKKAPMISSLQEQIESTRALTEGLQGVVAEMMSDLQAESPDILTDEWLAAQQLAYSQMSHEEMFNHLDAILQDMKSMRMSDDEESDSSSSPPAED